MASIVMEENADQIRPKGRLRGEALPAPEYVSGVKKQLLQMLSKKLQYIRKICQLQFVSIQIPFLRRKVETKLEGS